MRKNVKRREIGGKSVLKAELRLANAPVYSDISDRLGHTSDEQRKPSETYLTWAESVRFVAAGEWGGEGNHIYIYIHTNRNHTEA